MKCIYIDTETTGLIPGKNEVVQLAYIIEIGGEVKEEGNIFLRPERPDTIEAEALAITGKTREELMTYPIRSEGYRKFVHVLGKYVDKYNKNDKFIWIGQCPDFDKQHIERLFKDLGDNYFGSWFDRRLCDLIALSWFMKMAGIFNPPDLKLTTVASTLGIQFEAHDALADIKTTRAIIMEFMNRISKDPQRGHKGDKGDIKSDIDELVLPL